MPPDRRQLVIDLETTTELRRRLGPIAWCVLETLAGRAEIVRHTLVAECGSRSLASDLGVSKDSAARGLRVLIAEGLVERLDQRDPCSGRFGSTAYRVSLSATGIKILGHSAGLPSSLIDPGPVDAPAIGSGQLALPT